MEARRLPCPPGTAQTAPRLVPDACYPVSCTRCSAYFPCDPATLVPCPLCRAAEGEACRRPPEGGHHRSHYTRALVARRLGLVSPCSALTWDDLHAVPVPFPDAPVSGAVANRPGQEGRTS